MNRHTRLTALLALALAARATAAIEGLGKDQYLRAVRATGRIAVDGKLDEPSWAAAPVFDGMLQRFPEAGAKPSERTEVRVLYDDEKLYVGITAYDSEPTLVNRRLARRDSDPYSDAVQVMIDPTHDHRTGYVFYLNAGGVQGDGIIYDDRLYSRDWDGIWDGAAGSFERGWVAEYAIPLSLLRFPSALTQTWGFCIRRDIARKNEELDSVGNPRSSNASVSRFGHLVGIEGLKPRQPLELTPYVATRSSLRPQYDDIANPRLLDPSADFGLDLKASLASDLTLNATLNPDFGQVEADRLLLNLSTFESYFPEKRPFFTQGMEIFQPVGSEGGPTSQTLFYSRRIGLTSPILGAAKLTGTVGKGIEIGVLDAFVMAAQQGPVDQANPDRRFLFHPERPLHLGPNDELPDQALAPTNYMTGVVHAQLGEHSTLGAIVAAATPVAGRCTAAESAEDNPLARCLTHGGNAVAGTFDVRTADGQYGVLGQLTGSQTVGGPPERVLQDGTVLRRGGLGAGGFIRGGKIGGEGLRFTVQDSFMSPTLELNATGFQRVQNENSAQAMVAYSRPNGFGPFKAFWAQLAGGIDTSTDGRFVPFGTWFDLNSNVTLPSFDQLGMEMGAEQIGELSVREIPQEGVPFERLPSGWLSLWFNTNPNRPVMLYALGALGLHRPVRPSDDRIGWGAEASVVWRPHDTVETEILFELDRTPHGPRFVAFEAIPYHYVFGELESRYASVTLRQQWIVNPRLSLQAYAQLFTDWGAYSRFYFGHSDAQRTPIRVSDLSAGSYSNANFYDAALNVNVVARWEYALGSTLYLVYTRSQGIHPSGGIAPRTLSPIGLLEAPANDAVLVKWTYYFSR